MTDAGPEAPTVYLAGATSSATVGDHVPGVGAALSGSSPFRALLSLFALVDAV